VRRGGEHLEVLLREFGVGHGEELRVQRGLPREVAESESEDTGGRSSRCWRGGRVGLRANQSGAGPRSLSRDEQESCERKQGCERTKAGQNRWPM
jgi:hypothetical protein